MNVTIKISVTDDQRNRIAIKLAGKNTKRLATRADMRDIVEGHLAALLDDIEDELQHTNSPVPFDASKVPAKYRDKPLSWQMGWYRGRYITQPFTR